MMRVRGRDGQEMPHRSRQRASRPYRPTQKGRHICGTWLPSQTWPPLSREPVRASSLSAGWRWRCSSARLVRLCWLGERRQAQRPGRNPTVPDRRGCVLPRHALSQVSTDSTAFPSMRILRRNGRSDHFGKRVDFKPGHPQSSIILQIARGGLHNTAVQDTRSDKHRKGCLGERKRNATSVNFCSHGTPPPGYCRDRRMPYRHQSGETASRR